jgi:dolichol-phosphate mannosyltransferase
MSKQKRTFQHVNVVIPAYRESKNLAFLLPRLIKTLPGASVVVVDDSDPPESKRTESVVRNTQYPHISIIKRAVKKGRGSAVMDGFRRAFMDAHIRYFIEMDADLAHAPEECIRLINASSLCDMVIGSRYLQGSAIENWPLYRLIQSKIINFVLRYWLGLRISDYTNGFRLYKRPVIDFLMHSTLKEKGFIALSEMAYKIQKKRFTIGEVPVTFSDRQHGKSNADFQELMHALFGALRLRFS